MECDCTDPLGWIALGFVVGMMFYAATIRVQQAMERDLNRMEIDCD